MEPNRAQQCMLNMKPQFIPISKEDKLAKPIILISGFLFSLWTYCIFIMGCTHWYYRSEETFIVWIGLATHLIISYAATKGVHHGVRNYDRVFLLPWMGLKIVEGILLFTGSILCSSNRGYIGLTIVGILLLMAGVYLTMCVYTTYKKMAPEPEPPASTINDNIPEHPPAYDSFTNQKDLA